MSTFVTEEMEPTLLRRFVMFSMDLVLLNILWKALLLFTPFKTTSAITLSVSFFAISLIYYITSIKYFQTTLGGVISCLQILRIKDNSNLTIFRIIFWNYISILILALISAGLSAIMLFIFHPDFFVLLHNPYAVAPMQYTEIFKTICPYFFLILLVNICFYFFTKRQTFFSDLISGVYLKVDERDKYSTVQRVGLFAAIIIISISIGVSEVSSIIAKQKINTPSSSINSIN